MKVLATYELLDPIELQEADGNTQTYTTVNIVRRLCAKDVKGINIGNIINGNFNVDDMLAMLEPICNVPMHVLDELSFDDVMGLSERAAPFFMRGSSRKDPKASQEKRT